MADTTPGRPSVLLVDTHLISREGTRALFGATPDLVLVGDTGDGRHALTMCEELRPDIVILDVELPRPSAPQVAMRLRCSTHAPGVIGLSGVAHVPMMTDMFAAGAAGFLLRDRGFSTLVDAVKTVTAGGVFIDVYQMRGPYLDSDDASRPDPSSLSLRERQTLQLMASGMSTKQIASTLHLSPKTVETHRAHIYTKLNIDSLVTLTKYAISHGLASVD